MTYGKNSWTALVEVKTGDALLEADQINDYWDVARSEGFDHVITISNEIAPNADSHPTHGLRVRASSPVQVSHLSWTAILTTAVRLKQHAGVGDPEQAFILGELIRYLEHPASGALAFTDMGANWVAVRDAAKTGTVSKRDQDVEDVAVRWDQLLRYAALRLGSDIGEDVVAVLSKTHRDPKVRTAYLVDQLTSAGKVDGSLRIPNTVGDLHLEGDLHGQYVTASVDVSAPEDRGARARVSWLVGQLKDAPASLVIESYAKNARTPTTTTLNVAHVDPGLGDDKRDPARFRVVMRVPMGVGRKTGKKSPGFIDSVLALIESFYGQVVQNLRPWTPRAPKIKGPTQLVDPVDRTPVMRDAEGTAEESIATGEPPEEFRTQAP